MRKHLLILAGLLLLVLGPVVMFRIGEASLTPYNGKIRPYDAFRLLQILTALPIISGLVMVFTGVRHVLRGWSKSSATQL
jgi:hypothetical protein